MKCLRRILCLVLSLLMLLPMGMQAFAESSEVEVYTSEAGHSAGTYYFDPDGLYEMLYEKRCQGIMKKYDLKIADIDILHYVSHAGDRNLAKDIADEGMSKANVSKSVEHLRQKGYVALHEDKEDRRCVHIELTDAAAPIILEINNIRKEMGDTLSTGISVEDRAVIARVMKQLCQNMAQELIDVAHEEE